MTLPHPVGSVVPFRGRLNVGNLRRGRQVAAAPQPVQVVVISAAAWRYQWHEIILCRRDLARSDLAVAGVLMHAHHERQGFAQISLLTLASKAGCSRGSVAKSIQKLQTLGFIEIANANAKRSDGTREVSRYRLTFRDGGIK